VIIHINTHIFDNVMIHVGVFLIGWIHRQTMIGPSAIGVSTQKRALLSVCALLCANPNYRWANHFLAVDLTNRNEAKIWHIVQLSEVIRMFVWALHDSLLLTKVFTLSIHQNVYAVMQMFHHMMFRQEKSAVSQRPNAQLCNIHINIYFLFCSGALWVQ
jgi:hypothetical protein